MRSGGRGTRQILAGSTSVAALLAAVLGLAAPAGAQTPQPGVSLSFLEAPNGGGRNTTGYFISGDGRRLVYTVSSFDPVTQTSIGSRGFALQFDGASNIIFSDGTLSNIGASRNANAIFGTNSTVGNGLLWTEAGGYRYLPSTIFPTYTGVGIENYRTVPEAANADGTVFLVTEQLFAAGTALRYLWSPTTGFQRFTGLDNTAALAGPVAGVQVVGMIGDAQLIFGSYDSCIQGQTCSQSTKLERRAFRWTPQGGYETLPHLSNAEVAPSPFTIPIGQYSEALDISADGATIIGSSIAADQNLQAVRWRNGSVEGLGYIPNIPVAQFNTYAVGASADGSVIVGGTTGRGVPFPSFSANSLGWRWTQATGMQSLNSIVQNAGLSLNGWTLFRAEGVSDDGRIIIGNAFNSATNAERGFYLGYTNVTQSRALVEIRLPDVTQNAIVNQTFATRVLGNFNGRPVYEQSFSSAINSVEGQDAVEDARLAILARAGLRRLSITGPVSTGTTVTTSNPRPSTVDEIVSVATSLATITTGGPATVATGDRGLCATPASDGVEPTGCSLAGTPVQVPGGESNVNVYTNTINSLQRTTTVTVDQHTSADYAVNGVAGNQLGTVHALVGAATTQQADRLSRSLLNGRFNGSSQPPMLTLFERMEANASRIGATPDTRWAPNIGGPSPWRTFAEGFGMRTSFDADDRRGIGSSNANTYGFAGGIGYQVAPGLVLGAALQWGETRLSVRDPAFPESGKATLTQPAFVAAYRSGAFSFSATASAGFGRASTRVAGLSASRDISMLSAAAEAGYDIAVGDAKVTPVAGARFTQSRLGAFTETAGPFSLLGLDTKFNQSVMWVGAQAAAPFTIGPVAATFKGYARALYTGGEAIGFQDVSFAAAPALQLRALAPGMSRFSAEMGASFEADITANMRFYAAYDGRYNADARSHQVTGGLRIVW